MKKIMVLVIVMCFFGGAVSLGAAVVGDANGDGRLGAGDAVRILQLLAGVDDGSENLRGVVYGSDGKPLAGARVSLLGGNATGTTDLRGKFALSVEEEPRIVLVSKDGYIDSYQIVNLPDGTAQVSTFLLRDSLVSSPIRSATDEHKISSNQVGVLSATLDIPAQVDGTYDIGEQTGLPDARISIEYFDLTYPLPFPLPSESAGTRSDALDETLTVDRQAPIAVVTIKPTLLALGTAAQLEMPDLEDLQGPSRVLWFDPSEYLWKEHGQTDAELRISITKGGMYGIFEETEDKVGDLKGKGYPPGAFVVVGDQVYEVNDDGVVYIQDVHIPLDDGALNVAIVNPTAGTISYATAKPIKGTPSDIGPISAPTVGLVSISAGSTTLTADGTSWTYITADVRDSGDTADPAAAGTEVVFTTTAGTPVTPTTTTIDGVGKASFKLVSPTSVGSTTVSAAAGGSSSLAITISFVPGPASSIALSTTDGSLAADGTSTTTVQAVVTDANGNLVGSELVSFTVADGTLAARSGSSDTDGIAAVTYTAPSTLPGDRTDTVTASLIGGATDTADIALTPAPAASVSVGSDVPSIVADGAAQATLTATVKDRVGNSVVDGTVVTFAANAGDLDGTVEGTQSTFSAATDGGQATAILTAPRLIGSATITATSGDATGNSTIDLMPGVPAAIAVRATHRTLLAVPTNTSLIIVDVEDANGNTVADGEVLTFSVSAGSGTLSASSTTTEDGSASVTYTASNVIGVETITVQASSGATGTVSISLTTIDAETVFVSANPESVTADGSSQSTITASLIDFDGDPVSDGNVVIFTTDAGDIDSTTDGVQSTFETTSTDGKATATLTAPTVVGSAKVTATSSWIRSGEITIEFVPGQPDAITLVAAPGSLPADGSSTSEVAATVEDANGNTVADGETIAFSVSSGAGTLSAASATTESGVASVTYTASDTVGIETVTAQASTGATGTVAITLTSLPVGSIPDVSADPPRILADGVSRATITATVNDTGGNPVADGAIVDFSTTNGALSATSATTTGGKASVALTAPTSAGSATVAATSRGFSNSTSVGFVTVDSVSVSADPTSIAADGMSQSTITAVVKDDSDESIPDGSEVVFTTTEGDVDSSTGGVQTTFTTTTTDGEATAVLTSAQAVGTVTITATSGGVSGTATVTFGF